jgi:hypothetical protein
VSVSARFDGGEAAPGRSGEDLWRRRLSPHDSEHDPSHLATLLPDSTDHRLLALVAAWNDLSEALRGAVLRVAGLR